MKIKYIIILTILVLVFISCKKRPTAAYMPLNNIENPNGNNNSGNNNSGGNSNESGNNNGNVNPEDIWDGSKMDEPKLENNIYYVHKASELAWLAKYSMTGPTAERGFSGKTIKIMEDIDFGSHNFDGIGTLNESYANFAGTFDGNGKIILNVKLESQHIGTGLINSINCGIVKNVIVKTGSVSAKGSASAIVGLSYGGTIENCKNYISVTATAENRYAGSILGSAEKGVTTIKQSENYGTVTPFTNNGIYGEVIYGATVNIVN